MTGHGLAMRPTTWPTPTPRCRHPSDPQRRARKLPLGTLTHARACSTATAGSPAPRGSLGPRRHRRGPRNAEPRSSGRSVGGRTNPPHHHLLAMQQRPSSSTSCSISPSRPSSRSTRIRRRRNPAGFPFRRLATEEGVSMPDHFRLVRGGYEPISSRAGRSRPGVTEVAFAPALAAEEIRQSTRPQQAASTTSPS